uniref:Uncharacterized protein n=1 Tax=Terrapene triunguis TaxID=2587831 RepID=A0A674I371_9SAUR
VAMGSDFYLRYYVGHKGKFGHEFLEFEFRPDGEGLGPAGEGGPGSELGRGAKILSFLHRLTVWGFLICKYRL